MMGQHGRNLRQRAADAKAREHARTKALAEMRRTEQATLIEMRRKLLEAEAFNREVARIVGRTSILAGAPTHQMFESMNVLDARARGIRVAPEPPPIQYMAFFERGLEGYALPAVRAEVMHMLDFDVVRDPLRYVMHMRVILAGHEVRYTISMQALRTLDREELARRLVHELLAGLAPKIGR